MVAEKLKSNITLIVSFLVLVVSVLALVFGNNLYDRINGPRIIMTTSKSEFKLPQKIVDFIDTKNTDNSINTLPEAIRVIAIKNAGSNPSRNLIITLELDGLVFQHKINSTEKIENLSVINNQVAFTLPRLSKNAEISMMFWMSDNNYKFQSSYADDKESGAIETLTTQDEPPFWKIASLLIMVISLTFIMKEVLSKLTAKITQSFERQSKIDNNLLLNEIEDKMEEQYSNKLNDTPDKPTNSEFTELRKNLLKELIKITEKL